ncbi:MAG TPA: cyclase family protein [Candidatus Omnitrophica bacterium]|nr:cyclase family protein [Candidatus Omnitrophota bacterium]
MKIIDLSLPIDDAAYEVHHLKIERISHKEGINKLNKVLMKGFWAKIKYLLGKRIIRKEDLPDEEFLSLEIVHCPVHIGTHLDYTFHYGSKTSGESSKFAEQIPLEYCFCDGVKIDISYKKPNQVITAEDLKKGLENINYSLKPKDIVLLYTGCDKLFGTPQYFSDYPALDISCIDYLLEKGIKIFGIDTMGIDRPYKFMIKEFLEKRDPAILWPVHFYGRKKEFIHIERLTNLDKLPFYGFKVVCFPIKIRKTGAAWARVVAILD